MKKGFVFVNGYGLTKFKSSYKGVFTDKEGFEFTQYQGIVKLPKGVFTGDGGSWIESDYWFCEYEIFETKEEALLSLLNG